MSAVVALVLMFIVIIALLLVGLPVAFAFGLGAFLLMVMLGLDIRYYLPAAVSQLLSFPFVALPLFIIMGAIVGRTTMADRLTQFALSLVGRLRSGLGGAVIIANAIFGAMSGSSISALASIGAVTAPRLKAQGYSRGYVTALLGSSCLLSLLIPPSVTMIVFGIAARLPIGLLFLAGFGPGLCLAFCLVVINMVVAHRTPGIKVMPRVGFGEQAKEIVTATRRASFTLTLPVLILGGIYGGFLSPTEAAGAATIYAILIGFLIHRDFTPKKLLSAVLESGARTGSIIFICFFFFMVSKVMITERVADQLLALLLTISESKYVILLLLNIMMLLMGMVMDDVSALILIAILLLPVAEAIGVNPLHFGTIAVVNLALGCLTPPVAPISYMAGAIAGNVPLSEYIKPMLSCMVFAYLPVLLLTIYIPALSLTIPNLWMGM